MKKIIFLLLIVIVTISLAQSQVKFRSGTFLHHSTGGCIWGPNGSNTSVPLQMVIYNDTNGYTGSDSVWMDEDGWPTNPWINEWERWHRIFYNQDTVNADIRPYLQSEKIIVIKSCYPSSAMTGVGVPSDTLVPTRKTIYNYKWHWRSFLNMMESHPENFFVIWTNAPLVQNSTNPNAAMWSHQFCTWAKDTLAEGLDPVYGSFPDNVYVFDFFHKLADTSGYLQLQYAQSSTNSHPNAAATELVAPQFVQEIFDASIYYESIYTGIKQTGFEIPGEYTLYQNYPNPFNPTTKIKFQITKLSDVKLVVYDALGREVATLVDERLSAGSYSISWDGSSYMSGVYFCKMIAGDYSMTKKMLLIK